MGIENVSTYTYNTLSKDTYLGLFEALPERDKREYSGTINLDVLEIIKHQDILSRYIGSTDKQYIGSELDSDEFKEKYRELKGILSSKDEDIFLIDMDIKIRKKRGLKNAESK